MSFKLGGELLSYPAIQGRKPEPARCKRIRNSNGNADGIGARSITRHPDGQGESERASVRPINQAFGITTEKRVFKLLCKKYF
jgi:hypothetical protein